MSGILFMGTRNLSHIKDFYMTMAGTELWLEQEDCIVLKHGNMLFGFCRRSEIDTSGIITFFYPTVRHVDETYQHFMGSEYKETTESEPRENTKYRIHHFFARDPEGRRIEFQSFLHPLSGYLDPLELLKTRRSVRTFMDMDVPESVLSSVLETCRFAPTSCNSESYYFILVRDDMIRDLLATTRGSSSAPIAKGPLAVAICADPATSRRHIQDGCIAAYHFMVAAWGQGLGTCWIAAMDRDDVKKALGVPQEHYIATITPLGYPSRLPDTPHRRGSREMVRILE